MADEQFYAINAHDTVGRTTQEDFEQKYEPAGYRRLGDDEVAPIQQHEIQRAGTDSLSTLHGLREAEHGHARWPRSL